ncbi:GNAT family N-acetyltransferase [Rossellomorea sp. NS-SX7]|uniref:GNAT family N-acetyltransferase n=1 Tax=Rossellomorea sp. NS-SX7 TaxID=3463856 RepID=UPI0040581DCB
MLIRKFHKRDAEMTMNLFKETITAVNLGDYSKTQVDVWANSITSTKKWVHRLEESIAYVAVKDELIVGLVNINNLGEIDLLYVHKDHQRNGIGASLLSKVEKIARTMELTELFTEASITARPFFESKGYKVVKKQIKQVKGTDFVNYKMLKRGISCC